MSSEIVQVDQEHVVIALDRFGLSLQQNEELMNDIAQSQLLSVRRTFREQGSPAGSWPALSPNTIRRNPKKYGPGHKLLIDKGRLINSITPFAARGIARLGTNLVYARVHQDGSADLRGAAIGPQARIAGRSVKVGRHSYKRLREIHYKTRSVEGKDGKTYNVPTSMRTSRHIVFDKRGRMTSDSAAFEGPQQQITGKVREHQRYQNIRPRPYLVFRPEDPTRIAGIVVAYVDRTKRAAGLAGPGGV